MNISDYRILMVDDDEEFLVISEGCLKKKGCNIITISDPVKAIEYLKENEVDVLFIDYFMPQMTGEEVINELRKLNKEFVIVLQTGFSGEKPPIKMYEDVTIQGYYDKNSSMDELFLVVLSALRTAELNRLVKKNAEEKLLRTRKDEYFAKKISWITGEIRERLAAMNGPVDVVDDWLNTAKISTADKEMLRQRMIYMKENMGKIMGSMDALNISSNKNMTPKDMLDMIKELLKIEMWFRKIKIDFEISEATCLLNMEGGVIPYIICQDIENRVNIESKEISIVELVEGNNVIIKIESDRELLSEQKTDLERISKICEKLKLNINGNTTEIIIEKI